VQGDNRCVFGVVGRSVVKLSFDAGVSKELASKVLWKEQSKRVTAPYAKAGFLLIYTPSIGGHVKPAVNLGGPPPKAKYSSTTGSV
jgi:hypothetical protein